MSIEIKTKRDDKLMEDSLEFGKGLEKLFIRLESERATRPEEREAYETMMRMFRRVVRDGVYYVENVKIETDD